MPARRQTSNTPETPEMRFRLATTSQFISDASHESIRPGAQYAQARIGDNGGSHSDDDDGIRARQILPADPFTRALIGGVVDRAQPTRTDVYKGILDDAHLDAARRELQGEVVARRSDGTPFNHVGEVREAQRGLFKRIQSINNRLGNPEIDASERDLLQKELGEASRLLDYSEKFVPRR